MNFMQILAGCDQDLVSILSLVKLIPIGILSI